MSNSSTETSSGPKSWLDSIHSVSPYLAWVVSRVGFHTRDMWFVIPALAVSFVAVGLLAGFETMVSSVFGLGSVLLSSVQWLVGNPWSLFGVWAVTFVLFAWDMEWWTYDEIEQSESQIFQRVLGAGGVSFTSAVMLSLVWLNVALGSVVLIGGLYVISMWLAGSYVWRLMVFDEEKYNVRPVKSLWILGTRVPLVFGVVSYVAAPVAFFPLAVSAGISLIPPLFVGLYLMWRSKAIPTKPSGSSGSSESTAEDTEEETLSEADDDEFYKFEV